MPADGLASVVGAVRLFRVIRDFRRPAGQSTGFPILRVSVPWALVAALAGCVEPSVSLRQLESRRPPMPTAGARAPEQVRLTEADVRERAVSLVLAGDLPAAWRVVQEVDGVEARQRVRVDVVRAMAAMDPARAAVLVTALAPGPTQSAAVEVLLAEWWSRDAVASERWVRDLPQGPVAESARQALAVVAVRAGGAAWLNGVRRWPPGAEREAMVSLGLAAWARERADEALAWVRELPAGAERDRLGFSLGFALAERDPRRARAWAEILPEGRERALVLHRLAETWVAQDPAVALAWARGLPAGPAREAALTGIDTGLGVPTSRAAFAGPDLPGLGGSSGKARERPDWPELASAEFARWLAVQAPGLSRDEAVLGYVRERMNGAGGEVGTWVAGLPGGITRDRALALYLETIAPRAPSEAAAWLRNLPSSDRNMGRIEQVGRAWLRVNPEAADAWLAENGVAPERREWLRFEAGR